MPGHVRKGKMNWHSNTFPIGKLTLTWAQVTLSDPKWPKLSFRSSATTTLRPNIAIVRDSGTTQTIVNNAIVNNGSRVPISRNIVKDMEPVRDHIARVKTVIVVSGTSWYWWLKVGDNFWMQNFWMLVPDANVNVGDQNGQNCHQHLQVVINTFCLQYPSPNLPNRIVS